MMDRTLVETQASMQIQHLLMQHSPRIKIQGNHILILCPFHAERTPSCSVSLGGSVPPGVFHCWSCHAKGRWPKLAAKMGISTELLSENVHSLDTMAVHQRLQSMLETYEHSTTWDEMLPTLKGHPLHVPVVDWKNRTTTTKPRVIKVDFLRDFGCKRFLDPRTGEAFLIIPGNVHGRTQFLVMARMAGQSRRPKYIASKRGIGIIGLDEAVALKKYRKHRTLLVVEGPRDALSLLQHGIPACAVSGTSTWDKRRLDAISDIDPDRVCLLFDNDDAGRDASRRIVQSSKYHLPIHNLLLPGRKRLGHKLDPADLGKKAHKYLYRLACANI